MPTIEDVAKLAGLSRTTVSRVINNQPYVSEMKKKLVFDAMKQLGYVPNSSARSLRNQKTEMIAVLIPRVMNPFFSQLIESLEIAAAERGYQLIVCQTRYSLEKELNYMNLLKTKQVDGVILASIQNDWATLEPFLKYGPIVLCNEFKEDATVPMVRLNQRYGGYILTKHLLDQGHQNIAYCCGGYHSTVAQSREVGFLNALNEYNIVFDENIAFRHAFSIEDGRRVFHQIKEIKKRPTAVFTGSDEVAAGIIAEAKVHGWGVPTDLAVVGFDNQAITEIVEPTITTVNQPVEKMAEITMHILIEKIQTKECNHREVHELPLELVIRDSTVANKLAKL